MNALQELGISRRREDMSPDGFLQVSLDAEGDFIVTVSDGRKTTSVEFVCHCAKSPAVIEALRNLKSAIDQDNKLATAILFYEGSKYGR